MESQQATNRRNVDLFSRRVNAGLSQAEAAQQIGVSERVYSYAEQGGIPQPRHAVKFAHYYGVPVTDLFYPDLKAAA